MVALSEQNIAARARFLRSIAEGQMGEVSGDRCLMIGSGSGRNTTEFGRDFNEVHALDVVPRDFPDIVDHALLADGTRLPYDDGVFDLTAAISVIEHVLPPSNRKNLVEEMVRCTSSGGYVFFQIPNGRFPLEIHTGLPLIHWIPGGKELAIRMGHTTLEQVHIPSRGQLEKWVQEAGGRVVESRGITYPKEAIPGYESAYEILESTGIFRLFPFGHVVIAQV